MHGTNHRQHKTEVHWLQYKDKARQKQRQNTLKQQLAKQQSQAGKIHKTSNSKAQHAQQAPVKKLPAAKRRLLESHQDEASFADDYRQLKKLKNGRISEVGLMSACAQCIDISSSATCHTLVR